MNDTTQAYVPGVCNINRAEIAYRRKAGYAGLAIFIVVGIVLLAIPISRWFRLVLFLPAFVAAIGFLQARNRFCVAYGANGKQNASEGSASASAVEAAEARQKDKQKSRIMNLQAALMALLASLLVLVLPMH